MWWVIFQALQSDSSMTNATASSDDRSFLSKCWGYVSTYLSIQPVFTLTRCDSEALHRQHNESWALKFNNVLLTENYVGEDLQFNHTPEKNPQQKYTWQQVHFQTQDSYFWGDTDIYRFSTLICLGPYNQDLTLDVSLARFKLQVKTRGKQNIRLLAACWRANYELSNQVILGPTWLVWVFCVS